MSAADLTRPSVARDEVATFLYEEAELLDGQRYDDWLALWEEDARYWVPSNRDEIDPRREVSIVYDDRRRLEERVHRLTHSGAHSQEPPSRTCRLITNVLGPDPAPDGPAGDVTARSAFLLTDLRRGYLETYSGRYVHQLRPRENGLGIVSKKVLLTRSDEPVGNLTFLL